MVNGIGISNRFFYFVFTCSLLLFACKNFIKQDKMATELLSRSSFVHEYDSLIFLAERGIIKSSFNSSIEIYKNAFHKYPGRMRGKDIYNALALNVQQKKYASAISYYKELVYLGIDSSFLFSNSFFKNFISSEDWNHYYLKNYRNDRKIFEKKIDHVYKSKIKELLKKDQAVYCSISGSDAQITGDISAELLSIFNKFNRLPSDFEIGVSMDINKISQIPFFSALIIHSYQNGDFIFDDILLNSLTNGTISPEIIAFF